MTTPMVNVEPCKLCGRDGTIAVHDNGKVTVQCRCGMSLSEDLETFPLKWNGEWGLKNYYCNACGFNPCRLTTFGVVPSECPYGDSRVEWRKE